MAVKKTRKLKTPPENISPEGSLMIDDVTRLTLLRWDAEGRAAHNEMVVRQKELAEFIKQVDPQGRVHHLQAQISALLTKKGEAKTEYESLIRRTGEKLHIEMAGASFDEQTGIVHLAPAPSDANAVK
jgi:hypothetical protein